MGLGQYNSLGEYCVPHTASSVFLILIFNEGELFEGFRGEPVHGEQGVTVTVGPACEKRERDGVSEYYGYV